MTYYAPLVTLVLTFLLTTDKTGVIVRDIPNERSLHNTPVPMDGSDGLAGGMALFGFGSYGVGAWLGGSEMFALLNFSVATAALGFLFFNFHPARVFMGDAGSIPLGFLAAVFGMSGWQAGYWPFWFPLLVFSPFVADATVTLLKRARRGERLSQAHRAIIISAWSRWVGGHRNTALAEYALMLLAGASAVWSIGQDVPVQVGLLACWCAIYLGLSIWLDRGWQSYQTKQGNADVA